MNNGKPGPITRYPYPMVAIAEVKPRVGAGDEDTGTMQVQVPKHAQLQK